MLQMIIRGAYYYDKDLDYILVPHFTGKFSIVDCTRYIPYQEFKDSYYKSFIEKNKEDYIEFNGSKYYYGEYEPFTVKNWKTLSDLSELEHLEEKFDFLC